MHCRRIRQFFESAGLAKRIAVVGAEYDERLFPPTRFLKKIQYPSDLSINPGDLCVVVQARCAELFGIHSGHTVDFGNALFKCGEGVRQRLRHAGILIVEKLYVLCWRQYRCVGLQQGKAHKVRGGCCLEPV